MRSAKDRLIVALDVPIGRGRRGDGRRSSASSVSFYKIGYQLAFAGGLAFAETLIRANKKVFLDLKLHDIGNTVGQGRRERRQARRDVPHRARLSADHACRGRCPQRLEPPHPRASPVLTSYDDADLAAAGYDFTVPELVAERAAQARDIGVDGLVCSAEEAATLQADHQQRHGAGDAGHSARGAPEGRPEARDDARGRDRGRRRSSRGRPADRRGARSQGRRPMLSSPRSRAACR